MPLHPPTIVLHLVIFSTLIGCKSSNDKVATVEHTRVIGSLIEIDWRVTDDPYFFATQASLRDRKLKFATFNCSTGTQVSPTMRCWLPLAEIGSGALKDTLVLTSAKGAEIHMPLSVEIGALPAAPWVGWLTGEERPPITLIADTRLPLPKNDKPVLRLVTTEAKVEFPGGTLTKVNGMPFLWDIELDIWHLVGQSPLTAKEPTDYVLPFIAGKATMTVTLHADDNPYRYGVNGAFALFVTENKLPFPARPDNHRFAAVLMPDRPDEDIRNGRWRSPTDKEVLWVGDSEHATADGVDAIVYAKVKPKEEREISCSPIRIEESIYDYDVIAYDPSGTELARTSLAAPPVARHTCRDYEYATVPERDPVKRVLFTPTPDALLAWVRTAVLAPRK